MLVAQRGPEHKPIVRFLPALAQAQLGTSDLQGLPCWVDFAFDFPRLTVALDGPPHAEAERVGFGATQPRFRETEVVTLEEQPVRLGPEGQTLAVARGNGTPAPFLNILDAKLVKLMPSVPTTRPPPQPPLSSIWSEGFSSTVYSMSTCHLPVLNALTPKPRG